MARETMSREITTRETMTGETMTPDNGYGVALVSRIDRIIGLFCKRARYKRQHSEKETLNLIDPTNRRHPIWSWCKRACISDGMLHRCRSLAIFLAVILVYS